MYAPNGITTTPGAVTVPDNGLAGQPTQVAIPISALPTGAVPLPTSTPDNLPLASKGNDI